MFHEKRYIIYLVAKHNEIGRIGEDIAADFLKKKGLEIIVRNYWKPYGEIDIVARGDGKLRFVEVKSVSCEIGGVGDPTVSLLAAGRQAEPRYRPEENVHPQKMKRLSRVIESYLISHGTAGEWYFDVLAVYIDQKQRKSKVKWLKDIILDT